MKGQHGKNRAILTDEKVYAHLRARAKAGEGCLTNAEIGEIVGLTQHTARNSIKRLQQAGRIKSTGTGVNRVIQVGKWATARNSRSTLHEMVLDGFRRLARERRPYTRRDDIAVMYGITDLLRIGNAISRLVKKGDLKRESKDGMWRFSVDDQWTIWTPTINTSRESPDKPKIFDESAYKRLPPGGFPSYDVKPVRRVDYVRQLAYVPSWSSAA